MKRILFVCLGNICRSAMAEGILRAQVAEAGMLDVIIDSAGTGSWHIGEPPDSRATATARAHGIDISRQHARQIKPHDFDNFDLIIAMDSSNFNNITAMATPDQQKQIAMCLDFSSQAKRKDVPDPYYGGENGFEDIYSLLEDACQGIVRHINQPATDAKR